ncbi:MAG TPA: SLC13 family permease, partial [Candidatus Binatia bacterium]|nr:SLC13 family permease [Candidatus Binatia bacterium]
MVRRGQGILRLALLAAGAAGAVTAAIADPADARAAASQAWPAFVLVAGLLVVGAVAADDGVFEAVGAALARLPGGGVSLLVALIGVEAIVTAVLNLDTAVVFLTPVLLHAARRRGHGEEPFLYAAVFTANAASLLLPGSNLTNLIVLTHEHVSGAVFASRMVAPWVVSIACVASLLGVVYRRELRLRHAAGGNGARLRVSLGLGGIAVAAGLVLALRQPALPVVALACALAVASRFVRRAVVAADPALLVGVFGIAVALGTLGRAAASLGALTASTGRWATAGIGAGSAVLVNNLPAAVLLSSHTPTHPRALLLGLDLGPNLAVTGSLSA